MSAPRAVTLTITPKDRSSLVRWTRMPTAPQRTVTRCRIVLMLADGSSGREVARQLGVSRHTVDLWRRRFLEEGCDTVLRDRPGRGRRSASAWRRPASAGEHRSTTEICPPGGGLLGGEIGLAPVKASK